MTERLYSTAEAARILGIEPRTLRQVARSRGLGTRVHARALVFTAADLDALRVRPVGRPRKPAPTDLASTAWTHPPSPLPPEA